MTENLENLKNKDVKGDYIKKGTLPKGGVGKKAEKDFLRKEKQSQREQKRQDRNEKIIKLQEKKRVQIENKRQKLELQQLKRETSLLGRAGQQLRETQAQIKARGKRIGRSSPVRKTTAIPKKTKIPKNVDQKTDFIVIGNTVYQRKGSVHLPKPKKAIKKKEEDWGI